MTMPLYKSGLNKGQYFGLYTLALQFGHLINVSSDSINTTHVTNRTKTHGSCPINVINMLKNPVGNTMNTIDETLLLTFIKM